MAVIYEAHDASEWAAYKTLGQAGYHDDAMN